MGKNKLEQIMNYNLKQIKEQINYTQYTQEIKCNQDKYKIRK